MNKLYVHLDHLIPKENIFYTPPKPDLVSYGARYTDAHTLISYRDILDNRGIFTELHKPDFQRQTNAWTPETCVEFLDSLLKGWLIPHIILWEKPESNTVYILDGAHRISVVRAWLKDDWGDTPQAKRHYAKQDFDNIVKAAELTRELVKEKIGDFEEFFKQEHKKIKNLNPLEKERLPDSKKLLTLFCNSLTRTGLSIHWAKNKSYEEVAQSFIRINRGGQPLDEFEVFLIEYRQSSFVRSIMAIAGQGTGDYWPSSDVTSRELQDKLNTFSKLASNIHQRLFYPTHELPPTDVNQPFMPTPPYFRKHLYLREVLPILVNQEIIRGRNEFTNLVDRREYNANPQVIITSGHKILRTAENKLKHLISLTNIEPLSLDIVPLFYWYNRQGQLVRALCYGFIYWMLSGSEEDIGIRKKVFSGNRDRFEYILHVLKPEIASIHFSGGAALNTAHKTAQFFQKLLELLHERPDTPAEELIGNVQKILDEITNRGEESVSLPISKGRSGKNTAIETYGKIDKLFKRNHRCPICEGHINWDGKHQLDHRKKHKDKGATTPSNLEETHNFCNNNRDIIEAYKARKITLHLPGKEPEKENPPVQLKFDELDWGDENEFPPVKNELEEV